MVVVVPDRRAAPVALSSSGRRRFGAGIGQGSENHSRQRARPMDLIRRGRAPSVGAVMTPFPYFVGADDSVERAERLMREHAIRHLPVQEDGEVVGIISERDLLRLANPSFPALDKAAVAVRTVVLGDPYVVGIDRPLGEVVAEMAVRQIGSAIVVRHGKLAGILSVTDVCRVLAEVLEELFPPSDGNDAA